MGLNQSFKALSDPNRRRILQVLKTGRMNAGEIGTHFDMTAATLSYHLKILKDADLIYEEREGNYRIYSLNRSLFESILSYFYDLRGEKNLDEEPAEGAADRRTGMETCKQTGAARA